MRKRQLGEMKLMDWPKYSRCFPKESSILSKRIVGARQKNRRCFLKEATMLRGSSQYTLRNHLTAMHWEIVNGQKHSKIIVFPLGFREVFSLLPSCLCGFIRSNTMELGGFGKDTCFSNEIQYPYVSSCDSLSHLCQGKGVCFPIYPNWHNELIELFKNNTQSISTEPSK